MNTEDGDEDHPQRRINIFLQVLSGTDSGYFD